jgi:hypothetical protein
MDFIEINELKNRCKYLTQWEIFDSEINLTSNIKRIKEFVTPGMLLSELIIMRISYHVECIFVPGERSFSVPPRPDAPTIMMQQYLSAPASMNNACLVPAA